jgi:protein-S-isoprenylcysteine O-methyltransferase Ste14
MKAMPGGYAGRKGLKTMSKKEVIIGAVITFILAFWLIGISLDAMEASEIKPVISKPTTVSVIGWIITIWLAGFLLVTFWAIRKSKTPIIEKLKNRFTVRAVIPGYYIVVFIPIGIGMGFAVITGMVNWGGWLMCLSLPTLLILALIAIRIATENDKRVSKDDEGRE